MARHAPSSGTIPIRCRSTANRSTRPRRDLLAKYRTFDDRRHWRLPALYWSIQQRDASKEFPLILTSGRLVEYEGGGDETRSIAWLAELQQKMFVEVNPGTIAPGVRDGAMVWLRTPEGGAVKIAAMLTAPRGARHCIHAVPLRRVLDGRGPKDRYPENRALCEWRGGKYRDDIRLRPVTAMQETKTTLCRIEAA